ncbi:hypothetical protein ACFX2I_046420 [Malus domestica]
MNDFEGLLTSDFDFKPSGKSAPITKPRPSYSYASSLSPLLLYSWLWAPPDDPLEVWKVLLRRQVGLSTPPC